MTQRRQGYDSSEDDSAILALVAKYGRRVPRYTSYPTAPNFHECLSAETYREWLAALPEREPISLYLHVPFCEQLCWYCGCHTVVPPRYTAVSDYTDLLLREIELLAGAIGRHQRVCALHLGGGTPNILEPIDFDRVMVAIRRYFDIAEDATIAVECDPRYLDVGWARRAVAAGVNRASLGVQDLAPKVQDAINRRQPWSVTTRAIETLRALGVPSINIDLVYGLPHQTADTMRTTIETVAGARPERIALFGYAHVPWMKPRQALIARDSLPDTVARFRLQRAAATALTRAGYRAIGLDHFALPGDSLLEAQTKGEIRRNFQGYTTDAACVIGIGASAIGRLHEGYVQNAAKVADWRRAIARGRLATMRGYALTAEDRFRGAIIERLMCDLSVDLSELAQRHDRTACDLLPDLVRLCSYERDGLVQRDDRFVSVTERGRPFLRSIASVFDHHLEPKDERHASGI
jgi:oxygen-independent coproporphyrinogen III oxidase